MTSFSTLCACGFEWPKAFEVITAMQVDCFQAVGWVKQTLKTWVLGGELEKNQEVTERVAFFFFKQIRYYCNSMIFGVILQRRIGSSVWICFLLQGFGAVRFLRAKQTLKKASTLSISIHFLPTTSYNILHVQKADCSSLL